MPRTPRTNDPIAVSLPRLLAEEGISFRELGRLIGVDQSYLSRIRASKAAPAWRPPSKKTLMAIAEVFDLAPDYFPEYRQIMIEEAIATSPRLRDRIYDSLPRARR
ncbi:MAG TPA: helix-turn-helix transcriptional regulator [Gaiellaceae bacterium]